MDLKHCRFDGSKPLKLKELPTSGDIDKTEKENYIALTQENTIRIGELQDKLYAEGKEGLLIAFQAMDAAGKDSTIKHVLSGVNPQGVHVSSFKGPSKEDLAHDYLWRVYQKLPARGMIAVLNRSYYEDVLVVRVRGLHRNYAMPERCLDMDDDEFFDRRYKRISQFEGHLYENGYRVIKIYLNVGLFEQEKRFLSRIDDQSKNWKFSENDLAERDLWPEYMDAYEKTINATATKHAPWYVIPADQKFYARWLVSEAILGELRDMDPHYPEMPQDQVERLAESKAHLLALEDVEVRMYGEKKAAKRADKALRKAMQRATEQESTEQES